MDDREYERLVSMKSNDLQECVDEMRKMLESAKPRMFSQVDVIINSEDLQALLDRMERAIPQEVGLAIDIVDKQNDILLQTKDRCNDYSKKTQEKVKGMLEEAAKRSMVMVGQENIVVQAESEANEIMYTANEQAQQIKRSSEAQAQALLESAHAQADQILMDAEEQRSMYMEGCQSYLNDMLENLQMLIKTCIDETTRTTERFTASLSKCQEQVETNLSELNQTDEYAPEEEYVENEQTGSFEGTIPIAPVDGE